MIALAKVDPLVEELQWFARQWNPPALRSTLQFAVDELVIPEGETKNERFRLHTQPWNRLLLEEMDNPQWYNLAIAGCVQSGKSLMGFVLVVLKYLFENGETVIVGVPTVDETGRDKWTTEILPVIHSSGFSYLLPLKGPGSKGGFPKEVTFTNGARLKIMGGTGGDEKRSSYTARVVVITEADKMDEASEGSREADPITQMAARSMRWDIADRRLYMECTVSTTAGRIWQEYTKGTASRIVCPCPHCQEYVTPERESLKGWQDAANVLEAEQKSYFECPACDHALTAKDRRKMNTDAVLVHRGQEIDSKGVVTGPLPPTRTLGFRWNAFNNMFWSAGSVGVAEWNGRRKHDRDSANKELSQFYWTTPVDPPEVKISPLTREDVADRMAGYKQGIVPAECVGVAVAVDTGKRQLDWTALACMADSRLFVIDYGKQPVDADRLGLVKGFQVGFAELRTYLESGWHSEDGAIFRPAQVWIDSGYPDHTAPVYTFCLMANEGCTPGTEKYRPSKGHGEGQYMKRYSAPRQLSKEVHYIGKEYHMSYVQKAKQDVVHMNADYWKSDLHTRLGMDTVKPGAIVLFEAPTGTHDDFIDELLAEEQIETWIPGKGNVITWDRIRRKNHKLDSTYAATAAADFIIAGAARQSGGDSSWFEKQKRKSAKRTRR